MKKTRTVEQTYFVCDYCEEEITDHSWAKMSTDGEDDKHFHTVGGTQDFDKDCIGKFRDAQIS